MRPVKVGCSMTSSHDVPPVQLTGGELATVLAARRHWQERLRANGKVPRSYPQFDGFRPLSETQIDRLCERLNSVREPCDCELPGYFFSGVPGIIARMDNGRLAPGAAVERCDLCCRYESDEAARQKLVELELADSPEKPPPKRSGP